MSPSAVMPSGPSPTGIVAATCGVPRRWRRPVLGLGVPWRWRSRSASRCARDRLLAVVAAAQHARGAERGDRERDHEQHRERDEQRDAAALGPARGTAAGLRLRRGPGLGRWRGGRGAARGRGRGAGRHRRARRRRVGRALRGLGGLAGRDGAGGRGRRLALQRRPRGAREVAGRGVALGRLLRHRGADHGVERGGHRRVERARGGRRIAEVRVHLRQLGVARERDAAGQRMEEDAAERVDVGARVGLLAADLLGGGEVRRADELPRAGDPAGGRRVLGQPEVGEVRVLLALLGDQHVRRLDVAVDQAAAVGGVERRADLPDDADRALRRQAAARRVDERAQVGALDEAHREVQHAVGLAGLVDRHDVGVVDRRRELRLRLEAVAEVDVVGQL